MEKLNSNSLNNESKTGWEVDVPQPKTYDELLAEYNEIEQMRFLGTPDDYEDQSEYLEKKYIFEERQNYELKKLEEKLYEAYQNQK